MNLKLLAIIKDDLRYPIICNKIHNTNFQEISAFDIFFTDSVHDPLDYFYHNSEIISSFNCEMENDYDIYIVFERDALHFLSEIIKNKPIVFISYTDSVISIPFLIPNLYKVIKIEKNQDLTTFGIPNQLLRHVTVIPETSMNFQPQISDIRLIYLHDETNTNLESILTIVNFFNNVYDIETIIRLPSDILPFFENIVNSQVKLINNTDLIFEIRKSDIIITSGSAAWPVIRNGNTVIILGITGFGGLVTEDNLLKLLKSSFLGRIGGYYKEEIPKDLLSLELNDVINKKQLGIDLSIRKEFACEVDEQNNSSYRIIKDELLYIQRTYIRLNMKKDIGRIIPRLDETFCLVNNPLSDFTKLLKNDITGKNIFLIGQEEEKILDLMRQNTNIKDIAFKCKSELDEVYEFVLLLWHHKIITLSCS